MNVNKKGTRKRISDGLIQALLSRSPKEQLCVTDCKQTGYKSVKIKKITEERPKI